MKWPKPLSSLLKKLLRTTLVELLEEIVPKLLQKTEPPTS